MFTFHIDLGQIVIASLIGIITYFVKRAININDKRLDQHESILFKINGDIQLIMGKLSIERRRIERDPD